MLKLRTQVMTCKYKIIIQMVPFKSLFQGSAWSKHLKLKIYFLEHVKHVNIELCLSAQKEMADDGLRIYCTAIKIIHYNKRQNGERLKMIS